MAVNKVVYGDNTLIDLTSDTVTPETLLAGTTAHQANGESITGSLVPGNDGVSYEHLGKVGAKNLLKITAESGTQNGISYTVDKKAGTVFIPEGQTASAAVYISNQLNESLYDKSVKLNGSPISNDEIAYHEVYDGVQYVRNHKDEDTLVNIKSSWVNTKPYYQIGIRSGATIPSGGLLFKPMIRYAEDTDDTFAPYSETNLELTHDITDIKTADYGAGVNLLGVSELEFRNNGATHSFENGVLTINTPAVVNGSGVFFSLAEKYYGMTLSYDIVSNIKFYLWYGTTTADKKLATLYANTKVHLEQTLVNDSPVIFTDGSNEAATLTVSNFMISPAGVSTDTYYPYIKTNQQLQHDTDGVRGVGRNLFDIKTAPTFGVIGHPGIVSNTNLIYKTETGIYRDARVVGSSIGLGVVFPVLEPGEYEVSFTRSETDLNVYFYEANVPIVDSIKLTDVLYEKQIDNFTFTAESGKYYVLNFWKNDIVFGIENIMIRSAKYADDPTFYPYSENEIEFQNKVRSHVQELYSGGNSSLPVEMMNFVNQLPKTQGVVTSNVSNTDGEFGAVVATNANTDDSAIMLGLTIADRPYFGQKIRGSWHMYPLAYLTDVPNLYNYVTTSQLTAYQEVGKWSPSDSIASFGADSMYAKTGSMVYLTTTMTATAGGRAWNISGLPFRPSNAKSVFPVYVAPQSTTVSAKFVGTIEYSDNMMFIYSDVSVAANTKIDIVGIYIV